MLVTVLYNCTPADSFDPLSETSQPWLGVIIARRIKC
jgi:hypothetical protein